MLIEDLLGKNGPIGVREMQIIRNQSSSFLAESGGLPIFKVLPNTYNHFQKVKVRQHKKKSTVAEVFNNAFDEYTNLSQRAVFTYGSKPLIEAELDLFYVFPINGYKFLHSKEVTNSTKEYQQILNTMVEQFEDNIKAIEIITDLLKYTYVRTNLIEAITSKSEIIIYNIPFYYAIRVNANQTYEQLLAT